jgi:integrase
VPRIALPILVQLVTGIRFSELRALRKEDLDLRVPGLWIRRSQARKVVSTPKNKKARFQVLPRDLAEQLRAFMLKTEGQLLFPAELGLPLSNNTFNRAYSRLATEARVRRITSHGARHTSGSSYAVMGAGQKMIATLLGHTDTSATERYTHLQVDATRTLVEARWERLAKESKGGR